MLSCLHIQNIVLVEELTLNFEKGLTVLTGQTGAGKSILLDALHLALGKKADLSLIRPGKEEALVSVNFNEDDKHIHLKRSLAKKSNAWVNGELVGLSRLKEISADLIDIHGQQDKIATPSQYLEFIDIYGKIDLTRIQCIYKEWKNLEAHFDEIEKSLELIKIDPYLLDELKTLGYEPGEEEKLLQDRHKINQSHKIQSSIEETRQLLSTIQSDLYKCEKTLNKVVEFLPNRVLLTHITQASIEIQEAFPYLDESDPSLSLYSLEQIDDRLSEIRTMARKCQCLCEDLPLIQHDLDTAQERQAALLSQKKEIIKKIEEQKKLFKIEAEQLTTVRTNTLKNLVSEVTQHLKDLYLKEAIFDFQIDQLDEKQWSLTGWDTIQFLFSANPGSSLAPLSKVASGGEISRMMLALKVCLLKRRQKGVLIVDEIESGVGGEVAHAMGQKLRDLSQYHQVIAITHSPQLSACANHHFFVKKLQEKNNTTVTVTELSMDERIHEIARMLSGETITQTAKDAAKELLNKIIP